MTPGRLLREHEIAVNRHLEYPTGRLDQPDLGVRIGLLQLGRQTGGSGLVVSDNAILDRHLHWHITRLRDQTQDRRES